MVHLAGTTKAMIIGVGTVAIAVPVIVLNNAKLGPLSAAADYNERQLKATTETISSLEQGVEKYWQSLGLGNVFPGVEPLEAAKAYCRNPALFGQPSNVMESEMCNVLDTAFIAKYRQATTLQRRIAALRRQTLPWLLLNIGGYAGAVLGLASLIFGYLDGRDESKRQENRSVVT